MKKIRSYFLLLRIHQWVKNFFIFLPAFFALKLTDLQIISKSSLSFLAFSFLASAVYIFNDMLDVNEDRQHPTKCKRPFASNQVSINEGIVLILMLLVSSFGLFYFVVGFTAATLMAGLYLVQNILYTIKLKHIAVLDIVIISAGFVIRILIGGIISETPLTHWIVLLTFVLSLFLALAKRRDDVANYVRTGSKARKNLDGYNLEFLNVAITVMATVVVVCYLMYCTSDEVIKRFNAHIYLTSVFVIMGVLRYLQLTFVWMISGSPTLVLLKNRFLQVILLGWVVSFFVIIYYHKLQ
jgi:decaprenyl-phosphate phosphoribosyltransferase